MTDRRPPAELEVVVDTGAGAAHDSVDSPRWAELGRQALWAAGVDHGQLDLSFVDTDTIAELNQAHMDVVGPTDVLAFPIDAVDQFGVVTELNTDRGHADASADTGSEGEPPVLLGDIVICLEVAAANAATAKRPLEDEIALLVVHGVLHVMGLDHAEPTERAEMQAMERQLLASFHDPMASIEWSVSSPAGESQ